MLNFEARVGLKIRGKLVSTRLFFSSPVTSGGLATSYFTKFTEQWRCGLAMETYDVCEDGEAFGLADLWKPSKFMSEAEDPIFQGLEDFGKCCRLQLVPFLPLKYSRLSRERNRRLR